MLTCDCYGGCWADHSKGWPSVPQPRDPHKVVMEANVPYGSYVIVEQSLRLETEEYREAVMRVLGTKTPQPSKSFASFSRANRERCEAPNGFNHALSSWSMSDWMTATMGELGEAANIVKKLNRYRDGINGNKEAEDVLRAKLRKEIGDVFVYLDLTAQAGGFTIEDAATEVFNEKSADIGYPGTV